MLRRYAPTRAAAEALLRTFPTRTPVDPVERFWAMPKPAANGCLEWPAGARNHGGYGLFFIGGRRQIASRLAWMFTHGAIRDGLNVLHRCDNPPCVAPKHLFLGTQADNMADASQKGRLPGRPGMRLPRFIPGFTLDSPRRSS